MSKASSKGPISSVVWNFFTLMLIFESRKISFFENSKDFLKNGNALLDLYPQHCAQ